LNTPRLKERKNNAICQLDFCRCNTWTQSICWRLHSGLMVNVVCVVS